MRKLPFLLSLKALLTVGFALVAFGLFHLAPTSRATAQWVSTKPAEAPEAGAGLSLVFTNDHVLTEMIARKAPQLEPGPRDRDIAGLTSRILSNYHYLRHPFDDQISSRFLDRYLDSLDNLRMHFTHADLQEFERYRTVLDDMTMKLGDTTPAYVIFSRFMERLDQRARYVADLLNTERFTFDGDERYNLDRRKAARPKDLAEAKELWRQHLRYEILQEKLNNESPDEMGKKISRRYGRLLRTFKNLDSNDVLSIYLSSLTHVYDPHSDYLGKNELESFRIAMRLSLGGIGALLQDEDGYCTIKSLVAHGPAEKSKELKANDRIIAVAQGDGEPVDVVGEKLSKVVEMIRGPKGTEVRLTVIPADAPDPSVRKTVALIRDEVKLEDQEAKARLIELPQGDETVRIGVIDLPSFYAEFDSNPRRRGVEAKSTTTDVNRLIGKLKTEKISGLILDLRRNGGGSLEEAINLTGLFIKEGPVVQVRDSDGTRMVDRDTNSAIAYDGPLVVLTSRFSASASEILAGALQDYGRALIVGDSSTHGKGTVQSLMQLDRYFQNLSSGEDPGAVKITIRQFYRPSGVSTQLRGVIPDLILPSVNNYAEVGESALENPLPEGKIQAESFDRLDRIQPILTALRQRSEERVAADVDFDYIREDIEHFKKALADKSVSLNEAQRRKEKEEAEARKKRREEERKSRSSLGETVYEISVDRAKQPGLPEPVQVSGLPVAPKNADGDGEDADADSAAEARFDITLKEAKRILVDLIALLEKEPAVAVTK